MALYARRDHHRSPDRRPKSASYPPTSDHHPTGTVRSVCTPVRIPMNLTPTGWVVLTAKRGYHDE